MEWKPTPGLGSGRYVDIVARNAEGREFSFEVKLGGLRYSVSQMTNDEWLYQTWGVATKVIRIPR